MLILQIIFIIVALISIKISISLLKFSELITLHLAKKNTKNIKFTAEKNIEDLDWSIKQLRFLREYRVIIFEKNILLLVDCLVGCMVFILV